MGKQKVMKLVRIAVLLLMLGIMLTGILPAFAQISRPTSTFTINQLEAYRNCLEIGDQLYVIMGTVDYTTDPSAYSVADAFQVRLRDAGGVELGSTTFYAFPTSGFDYAMGTIYFPAATAPAWAGAYTVSIEGNPALHWLETTATHAMGGAMAYDAPAYTDETAASNSAAANDMTILPALPVAGDAYYFGSTGMFNILTVNVGTNGSWTGTYAWEYYNGSTWVAVSGLTDGTTGFSAGTGNRNVTYTCPSDWQMTNINGVVNYWLRFRVVTFTAIVTQPLGTQSWTNTMDVPPIVSSGVFSLWYDDGTIVGTVDRLTTRFRAIATLLQNDWGGATDLIEDTAAGKKLTADGETYFVNSVYNIREMCPLLFSASLSTPEFDENIMVSDGLFAGDDADYDAYGANNIYAQTFTASDYYQISGAWLKLYRVGNPGLLTLGLRLTVAGAPVGGSLVTGTYAGLDLTTDTDGEWYEFAFNTEYTLTGGTVYALVLDAAAGGVANYAAWRVDTGNGYAGGEGYFFNGAIWATIVAGSRDFIFSNTAFEGYTMNFRDQMANRLVGTRFDMTNLGTNLGLSRMWATFLVYAGLSALIIMVFCQGVKSYKPAAYVFAVMMVLGIPLGAVYLEYGVLLFVGGIGLGAYIGGYEKS